MPQGAAASSHCGDGGGGGSKAEGRGQAGWQYRITSNPTELKTAQENEETCLTIQKLK